MVLLNKTLDIIKHRENAVQKYVEDESLTFFNHLDDVKNKYIKSFCTQVICSTIGDAYDFFYYTHSKYNIFYKNIHLLDKDMGNRFYVWNSLYYTITAFDCKEMSFKDFTIEVSTIFEWDTSDIAFFRYFYKLYENDRTLFEVEFNHRFIEDIFSYTLINPMVLALAGNLFYNSHNRFACEFENIKLAL